jgi:PhoPQ-activated pathogenicity-related protein
MKPSLALTPTPSSALAPLVFQARLLSRRLGTAGIVGILLLIGAVAAFVLSPRLLKDADALQDSLAIKEQQAAQLAKQPVITSAKDQARLYTGAFPALSQNANDLKIVFDAAAKHNVELLKGEYQLIADPSATFITYSAVFPVKDRYGTLKSFANDVLTAMPHVALEELRMERPTSTASVLDARIRFTFIYKGI